MTTRAIRKPTWRLAVYVLAVGLGLALTIRAQDSPREDQPAKDPEARLRQRLDAHRERARKLAEEFLPRLLEVYELADQLVNQEIIIKRAKAEYENAKTTREVAELAVREYLEGTYRLESKGIEGELAVAKAELIHANIQLDSVKKTRNLGRPTKPTYSSPSGTSSRPNWPRLWRPRRIACWRSSLAQRWRQRSGPRSRRPSS